MSSKHKLSRHRHSSDENSDEDTRTSSSSESSRCSKKRSRPHSEDSSRKKPRKHSHSRHSRKHEHRHHKHDKKEKRHKKSRKSRSNGKSHKNKPKKEKTPIGVCTYSWGKYGVVAESDRWKKQQEYYAWMVEVKGTNPESLSRREDQELWKTFVEDYNTSTMPSKKYYDLERYEREKAIKEARRRSKGKKSEEMTEFRDEETRKLQELKERDYKRKLKIMAELDLLDAEKRKDMAEQQHLRRLQSVYWQTGDSDSAQKIAERLRPESPPE